MAKARLEQTRFAIVCFLMFYWFLFVFVGSWRPADSLFAKAVSPRSARVPHSYYGSGGRFPTGGFPPRWIYAVSFMILTTVS
jgi:hypothetical protein